MEYSEETVATYEGLMSPLELPVPSNEVPEDIPVGDSRSEELVTSSSSASSEC